MPTNQGIENRRWVSACLTGALVMLAVGALFDAVSRFAFPGLKQLYDDHGEIFRPWQMPTTAYMIAYAVIYGAVFGAFYRIVQRHLRLPGGAVTGLQYGLMVWIVGSAPIFVLMYASTRIPLVIIISWIVQNLIQYLVTGAVLGVVAGGARVEFFTTLPASAEAVWDLIQQKSVFLRLTEGMVHFGGAEHWPERPFATGTELTTTVRLFGVGPATAYRIHTVRCDPELREIETDERGGAIESWRHHMRVEPLGTDSCRYTDSIHIQAGWQTPLIWCFARWFYARRQQRLQKMAAAL